jgi:glutamate N-acetyltransferase / amino-acid N-acetyltransferase
MKIELGGIKMKTSDGSITSPRGFKAAGVACGLKKNGQPDLALIVSDCTAAAAGVFTRNLVKGHSLQLTREHILRGFARAVVINSGNANACVGDAGLADAHQMAALTASAVGCTPEQVLTGSTGVIGKRLNMDAIRFGIEEAAGCLSDSAEAGHQAEKAIMTTDLVPKEAAARVKIGRHDVTVAGMAKGSGMIHPNMATMIAVITTDCAASSAVLDDLLRKACAHTFNRVSVDGDTSVCDMLVILANGMAGNPPVEAGSPEALKLLQAIESVCTSLSKLIAGDGEGATKLIEVRAEHARTPEDAYKIVLAVARSPLVKTAIFGEDANWGRIITAAGYSGANFDPDRCDIYLGSLKVCENGSALLFDENLAKKILQEKEVLIRIDLQEGEGADRIWTCDFSYGYVRINGSYRT